MDAGDRNRTSPFAFTGNRFEFRAVGSNLSIAGPQVALNAMLAESLDYIATELEKATKGDKAKLGAAVQKLLQKIMKEHGNIIFNGDGYADAWQKEAAKRKLPNLKTSVDALPVITSKPVVDMFTKYGVFTERELVSREEVYFEQYNQALVTEALTCIKMARTMIIPAAVKYMGELAGTCASLKAIGHDYKMDTLEDVTAKLRGLKASVAKLETELAKEKADVKKQAAHLCKNVLGAMLEVRGFADGLEEVVADSEWPLPTYQEMLFIK